MKIAFIILLFVFGALFSNASHIPAWILGGEKPTHPHWKTYGLIALGIWVTLLVLINL